VEIDFVGVWDSVSSVGLFPETHPYTSINYSVKCFRQALALDERRTRFHPDVWLEDRGQELGTDLPAVTDLPPPGVTDLPPKEIDPRLGTDDRCHYTLRDIWQYTPPERDHADVKEVWFAGSHSDVGGGAHTTKRNQSLSFIPLRWMIKECILAKTGIQFDMDYLRDALDFDFDDLMTEMRGKDMQIADLGEAYEKIEYYAQESREEKTERWEVIRNDIKYYVHESIFDQLVLVWFWWILEFLQLSSTYQDPQGNWIRSRSRNFGRGRHIPFYKNKILVHETVILRIDSTKSEKHPYKPNARNWDTVNHSPMLQYVS